MNKGLIIFLLSFGAFLVVYLFFPSVLFMRWDCTEDKRYTLNPASVHLLEKVSKPLDVEVYLEGDFPASFRQLQNETRNLLIEFQKINPNISYSFIDPIKEKIDEDTLAAMGLQPSILPDVKEGKVSEILIYPYAVMKYQKRGVSLPLIVSKKGLSAQEQLNASIENLEFALINGIQQVMRKQPKKIAFLTHHDELRPAEFQGFIEKMQESFEVRPYFPENGKSLDVPDLQKLKNFEALVVAKPRKPFQDKEKLILDQYIMSGGKMLLALDQVNAEMDSLFRSDKILAFPYQLNLTDWLFHFGVRIPATLVQDQYRSAPLRLVVGEIQGNPQFENYIWNYLPLGVADSPHPITKNLNPVRFDFISPIDTLARKGLKKTVLFQSSPYSFIKSTPNYISLDEIKLMNDSLYRPIFSGPKILAILVEGNMQSAYKDRVERREIPNFISSVKHAKLIVISDGDVAKNQIYRSQPLPLGLDALTGNQYGNGDFLLNCLEYLTDDTGLMQLRNRTIKTRWIDKQLAMEEGWNLKFQNIALSPIILLLLGTAAYYLRRRAYAKAS